MDITLQRILSLIPKEQNGKYVRGAKKAFAVSIGYDSGDIISMWIKGTSESYKGKLYEISQKYNVSISWLKGETDEKNPAPQKTERDLMDEQMITLYQAAPDRIRSAVLDILKNGAEK